jgi:hypothetical protein
MSTAACSSLTPFGIFTSLPAGTLRSSLYEPGVECTYATRSPARKPRTFLPMLTITPAASRPSPVGISCA